MIVMPVMICPTLAGTTTGFWPGWTRLMLGGARGRVPGPTPGLPELRAGLMLVLTVGILQNILMIVIELVKLWILWLWLIFPLPQASDRQIKCNHFRLKTFYHLICATAGLAALVARSTGMIWAGGEVVVGGVSLELIFTLLLFSQFMEQFCHQHSQLCTSWLLASLLMLLYSWAVMCGGCFLLYSLNLTILATQPQPEPDCEL